MPQPAADPERDLDEPDGDQVIVLHGASWTDFERLLEIKGDKSVPRLAFWEGDLEIISPSWRHERVKSWIGRLLETWAEEMNIEIEPLGSWTVTKTPKSAKRRKGAGVEPDECYVLGTFGPEGPRHDRPDLAIELVWRSHRMSKLELYAAIGVPELWVWRNSVLRVYSLRDGVYEEVAGSVLLPTLDLPLLLSVLDEPSLNAARRRLRAALRQDP